MSFGRLPSCVPSLTQVTTTHNTFASLSGLALGTYYTSVVAYNHALEPSHVVCSDGVTIDTSGPEVTSVHVTHTYIKPGLVTDGEEIMYMDNTGYVYPLTMQSQDCRYNKCLTHFSF